NNLSKKINQKDENFKKVYEYFFRNFLTFENKHSIKNIAFWSINNRIINDMPTTTNSSETYHRYLNSKNKRKNQKIEKIIDILKQEEMRNEKIIIELKTGKVNLNNNSNKTIKRIVINRNFYDDDEFFDIIEQELNIYIYCS
ncbi:hypothetical protein DMUE_3140, partial [Dictyocoela muelleri]